jgi:hypothetical protein
MSSLNDLKHNFGNKIPPALKKLAQYFDKNPDFFAGSFEVNGDEYDGKKKWFKNNKEGYENILVFGIDGVGSLIGLWVKDMEPEEAPVVYLGGEGGGTILAPSLLEYLSVLAANRDWEPFDRNFMEEDEESEEGNKKFRKWLKKEFNISPAKDPMKFVKEGKKKFPGFAGWMKKVMA